MDIGQIVAELDQLEDTVKEASNITAISTRDLFIAGITVSGIALLGVFLTWHYLRKQTKYFDSHLNFLRRDTRGRMWSTLSWTTFEDGSTHKLRQSDDELTITVRILNAGFTPTLNITSWETYEMITSKENKPGAPRTTTRSWGSLPPNGFMEVSILVPTDEYVRSCMPDELFRAKITFHYTSATGNRTYNVCVDHTGGSVDVYGSASEHPDVPS